MEENFVDLRCGSRGEAIYPKLPLLDPVSGKRQDGRAPSDVRPICNFVTLLRQFDFVIN